MGRSVSFASQSWVRFSLTLAIAATGVVAAMPACSSGDDFTGKATGGASATGGTAGDASTTGGSGGSGGVAGTATGGVAGTGTGGVAGAAGEAGSGGVAGSGGAAGDGGTGGNPGGKDNGQPCANKTECKSNYCVDDVCCESECKGDCRSCKISGKEGLCTPYALSTDPEGDCAAVAGATACAGTCDGKGACDYAKATVSCGATVCASSTKSVFFCDGAGACKQTDSSCGEYQCSGDSCLTACSQDSHCKSTAWCELKACQPKKPNGGICYKDSACTSGICFANNCCETTCGPNFTCESGKCQCGGLTCASNEGCTIWYKDGDGDGFGDAGYPKLTCGTQKPAGHVADATDCDDGDNAAHPGQTNFYSTPRKGVGGYDYNCDNKLTRLYPVVDPTTCTYCKPSLPANCGITNCAQQAAFGCAAYVLCPLAKSGFQNDPGCGNAGDLKTCNASVDIGGYCTGTAFTGSTSGVKQACN